MKLTVFGATGVVGRELVSQALAAGDHLTAYVRNPAKLNLDHPELTVIAGELTDTAAVRRAVHGADAVISALGPSLDRKATGMPLIDGTWTLLDAMDAEGVERYVGMATPSLRDPRDRPSLLAHQRQAHRHRPRRLSRSHRIGASITRADIAAFLLAQTTDNGFHRAAPAISN